jgi:hypothetical protein
MSKIVEEYIKSLYYIIDAGDIESDQFNNALSIEETIKTLHKRGNVSDFDVKVLNGIATGFNFSEIATLLIADRKRVSDSFKKSCGKIAFVLGDEFTNTGFMYRVAARHAIGERKERALKEFFK